MTITTGTGLDLIPPLFISKCSSNLGDLMLSIFDAFWLLIIVPDRWKPYFTKPVHKSGDISLVSKYRPITALKLNF